MSLGNPIARIRALSDCGRTVPLRRRNAILTWRSDTRFTMRHASASYRQDLGCTCWRGADDDMQGPHFYDRGSVRSPEVPTIPDRPVATRQRCGLSLIHI